MSVYMCAHMIFLPGGCDALRWVRSPLASEPNFMEGAWPSASSLRMWGRVGVMIP